MCCGRGSPAGWLQAPPLPLPHAGQSDLLLPEAHSGAVSALKRVVSFGLQYSTSQLCRRGCLMLQPASPSQGTQGPQRLYNCITGGASP